SAWPPSRAWPVASRTGNAPSCANWSTPISSPEPGQRYRMHDLVRLYAIELAADPDDTAEAMERLLDHYVHTAYEADRRLEPLRDPLTLPAPLPGVRAEPV